MGPGTHDQHIEAAVMGPGTHDQRGRRTFSLSARHEIGNWLLDTARTAYPDRDWDADQPVSGLNPESIEITTLQLPALEIDWGLEPRGGNLLGTSLTWRLYARHIHAHGRHEIATDVEPGNDIEEICRRLRAALEMAVHTYRSPKT